jgi:hypothetical protein
LPFLIAVMHTDPHPFAREILLTTLELDLDAVTAIIPGHVVPL